MAESRQGRMSVGIDSVGVYVPRLYVDLTADWARVRAPALADGDVKKLVGKVTDGVGVRRMAIVDAHQDCATLAAMAAKRAIDLAGIDPRDIDYIAVGTETTVDQSKSTASYVLGMLERHYGVPMTQVGAPQFQFACIGATYALEAAVSRIRAGDNTKPYALVIASDISKYPLATAGEYTQGAGAVALLISQNPRVLAFEQGLTGTTTRDERDFFRPNWSAEAVVDGKYSIDVYLDCMDAAFASYCERARSAFGTRGVTDAVDHFLFHVPFPRMAEYAAARIFGSAWLADPGSKDRLAAEVPIAVSGDRSSPTWRRDVDRAVAKSQMFRDVFGTKVAPSLALARDIGNIYSGSLYLALASVLERAHAEGAKLAGQRVLFGSYGSGASSKVLSGTIADGYDALASKLRVGEDLKPETEGGLRVALSVAEYERLHGLSDSELDFPGDIAKKLRDGMALGETDVASLRAAWQHPSFRVRPRGLSVRAPKGEFALERLGTEVSPQRTDVGYRYYAWVP
jgi:hydroxymethylglutaryl-CoA synthase